MFFVLLTTLKKEVLFSGGLAGEGGEGNPLWVPSTNLRGDKVTTRTNQ